MHADHPLLAPLQALHRTIRDQVVASTERSAVESMSHIHADDEGDTIYAIDKVAEDVLVGEIDRTIARVFGPVVLVAEGLAGGRIVLPHGAREADALWTIIVDPIDGTRGLMYQKRPAWILTGVAPTQPDPTRNLTEPDVTRPNPTEPGQASSNLTQPDPTRPNLTQPDAAGSNLTEPDRTRRNPTEPLLSDVVLAVQTEIPLVKQHLSDQLWAVRGQGACAERVNRLTGQRRPLPLRPSQATTLAHGFASVARFFPGNRAELAALDDEIVRTLLGPPVPGKAQLFEDQYICTGGQLYELVAGHDRFIADLRSVVPAPLGTSHAAPGASLCCHPYDLCTELIARELGVIVTDEQGRPPSAPLNVEADLSWVGYANQGLRDSVQPVLLAALRARGWIA